MEQENRNVMRASEANCCIVTAAGRSVDLLLLPGGTREVLSARQERLCVGMQHLAGEA
jgi:hypothetical protein